ncbi:hypothetical protein [Blastopirellula marina]|uniref:Uncharacterized protein n=1 Tax=Blastopirellula marina TaxID=124 RepID=A0A2S8GP98_9BACT|nr:hypothetical protein [Blastopirellula marina]PQO46247.1 hypothetical protein C5Y93_09685 [Blastopirellula marina]
MNGKINPGIFIIMAGMGDLVMAVVLWFMFADGEAIWNYVVAGMVLAGLGTMAFGVVQMLRNM